MIRKVLWMGLMLSLFAFMTVAVVEADDWNKKTVLTFSQPVEIPGHVLPAGTYTFKLANWANDRHIVQVFNADESLLLATVMTVPNYRLKATTETVIRFSEVPRGSPEAIRAWFYPGNATGHEFVYPKGRATELARAARAAVPAIAADAADADALGTARIVAITPDEQEVPLSVAIQTTPPEGQLTTTLATLSVDSSSLARTTTTVERTGQDAGNARQLPQTASPVPLIVLFGLGAIGAAVGLLVLRKRVGVSAT